MRVIVATGLNSGSAEYRNMGDVAMLQVAVARLRELWPNAQIDVLTESAQDLDCYCPGAVAIPCEGCRCWAADQILLGQFHRFLPEPISTQLSSLKRTARRRWPALLERLIRFRVGLRNRIDRRRSFDEFIQALRSSDLFVFCGAGGFDDHCREWNLSTLNNIEVALDRGITVALVGQGMGPLSDPPVLARARNIFPRVDLISLRGGPGGPALLRSLLVDAARVLTTGDEAVEIGYEARQKELGKAVGINLRAASYSSVSRDMADMLRPVLHEFARRHNVPLIPVPIAFHAAANDHLTIRQLLQGFDDHSDGGITLDTPLKVIRQVGHCRIVVTGAYHAAVFALAQGIPTICLSNSAYYDEKFNGLQNLFGAGCSVLTLSHPAFPQNLSAAIDESWDGAPRLRGPLLASARDQIERSRAAYMQIKKMLTQKSQN